MAIPISTVAEPKALSWVKILRLQFYPMTWLAYTLGALGAASVTGHWNASAFWLGYTVPFLLEAATVLTNELFDLDSDRRNQAHGPFNGGSRVLVRGGLNRREVIRGAFICVGAALLVCALLISWLNLGPALPLLFAAMLALGPGYTTPPLKLAWRGHGEWDVALTHSLAAVLWGYLIQDAPWNHPFPWLAGLPMFMAIMPAILLAGMPDLEADQAAGKRTLVVRLGRRHAAGLALVLTLVAPLSAYLLEGRPALHGALDGLAIWSAPHAALLAYLLYRYWRAPRAGRIDGLLVVSLVYILWFAVFPVLRLL